MLDRLFITVLAVIVNILILLILALSDRLTLLFEIIVENFNHLLDILVFEELKELLLVEVTY